ncbi:MAG: hypothetical protein PHO08_07245 [Methylococcales bacterium]|nr:hypothetical protein [Methylococcales bacterium]MDD5633586.1 hypothetical protein [Methylococcales bacterium]
MKIQKEQSILSEPKQALSERIYGYRAKILKTVIAALIGCFIFPGYGWTLGTENPKASLQKQEEQIKPVQREQQEIKKIEQVADQKMLKNYCESGREMKVKITSLLTNYKASKTTAVPYAYKGQIVIGLPAADGTHADQCHIQFMTNDNGIVSGDIELSNLEPLY